jgi:hypothetical protein
VSHSTRYRPVNVTRSDSFDLDSLSVFQENHKVGTFFAYHEMLFSNLCLLEVIHRLKLEILQTRTLFSVKVEGKQVSLR